jgi:acetolactate synthase-1/2/3 large subunit
MAACNQVALSMPSCGELLIRLLEDHGVDTVFGIPGVHTLELYRALPASSLRHVTARHEQGVGFMADGYARVTGRPGVCFVITGPGMTNIATAMGQALADSVPMLVISSVNRRHQLGLGEGRLHELRRQQVVFDELSRFSHTLQRPDELPRILARAFGLFSSGRPGPVHIEIPVDVMAMPADAVDLRPWALPEPPAACPTQLEQAAAWLRAASKPLIAIGGGAVAAGAEVKRAAEALGAPVVNTVNAKGVIPRSHPLAVGGSGSCPAIREALREADVVLAVGTEFSETDYDFFFEGDVEIPGRLIRIDIDRAQLARNARPSLAICADARQALASLSALLASEPRTVAGGVAWAAELRERLREAREESYARFFDALQQALPGLVLVGDSAQPTYRAWLQYETEEPRRYFHSASGYGTLGYAIPAAIGARLGAPELPVVALIGDGAAQFTLGELSSAAALGLPVIFLLWNNHGYEEIRRFMRERGVEPTGVDLNAPDFLKVAEGLGCQAVRVGDLPALQAALRRAAAAPGPTLIELDESEFA